MKKIIITSLLILASCSSDNTIVKPEIEHRIEPIKPEVKNPLEHKHYYLDCSVQPEYWMYVSHRDGLVHTTVDSTAIESLDEVITTTTCK